MDKYALLELVGRSKVLRQPCRVIDKTPSLEASSRFFPFQEGCSNYHAMMWAMAYPPRSGQMRAYETGMKWSMGTGKRYFSDGNLG